MAWSTCASTKWPMRAFAMTGMVTVSMISVMSCGSLIRATPPSLRMSAGTRSRAMTATAPASSAIFACSAVTTSMITPPLSISARPVFTLRVPISSMPVILPGALEAADHGVLLLAAGRRVPDEDEVLLALEHLVDGDRLPGELAVRLLDALPLGVVVSEGHDGEVGGGDPHAHCPAEGSGCDEVDVGVLLADLDARFAEEALPRGVEPVGVRLVVAGAAAAGDDRTDGERCCKSRSRGH